MNIANVVLIVVIASVVGFACWYIYRSKKSGKKCIGCPSGGSCSSCGCGCQETK